MAWLILVLSGLFEAVWATALGRSEHFTQAAPTTVFVVALAVSMIGLGWAAKHIAIGTAYAVWTRLGAVLTAAYSMWTGVEVVSVGKIVFITGIVAAVVGLKLLPKSTDA